LTRLYTASDVTQRCAEYTCRSFKTNKPNKILRTRISDFPDCRVASSRQSGCAHSPSSRCDSIFRSAVHCQGNGRRPTRAPSWAARSPSLSSPSNQDSSAGSWRPVSRGDALTQAGKVSSLNSGQVVVIVTDQGKTGSLPVDLGKQPAQGRSLMASLTERVVYFHLVQLIAAEL